jgi:hypothetical protein
MQTEISMGESGFCEYHHKNPQVYGKFRELTLKTMAKGFRHYSAKGIFELVRWYTGVTAEDPDGFKINNSYTPFYARLFMREYPQYDGFFFTRKSRFDEVGG